MNEKRSWPGRPNRYSRTRSLIVIRPKSSATVVVVLPSTPVRSSKPALTVVSVSSVRSGRTSLIAPTSVVFPAPNPPATRILCAPRGASSECAEPIQDLLEHVGAGLLACRPRPHHDDRAILDQVGKQHTDHPYRKGNVGGDIGHRAPAPAHLQDPAVFRGQAQAVPGIPGHVDRDYHGEQVQQLADWLGPATGHRVWAHHRPRIPGPPPVVRGHGDHFAAELAGVTLGSAARCGLARLASMAIS